MTTLTDLQKKISFFLSKKKRALVCEKAGNGKTLCELTAFSMLKQAGKVSKLIVLTPKNAYDKGVWGVECKKHTSLKAISIDRLKQVIGSVTRERLQTLLSNFDVVYGKHTHLKSDLNLLLALRQGNNLICLDEVHAFKNPTSQLTLIARAWLRGAYAIHALTATPLSKSLEDTYNIINLIKPGSLGTFEWFRDTICNLEKVNIKTVRGRSTVLKINGFKNQALFDQLVSKFVWKGTSTIAPTFHNVQYNLSPDEVLIYKKIANGIQMAKEKKDEEWVKYVLESSQVAQVEHIKEYNVHSSRFIYLQYAADGILDTTGGVTHFGEKLYRAANVIQQVVAKGQSIIVYFDYYASLQQFKFLLQQLKVKAQLKESTGRHALQENEVTEASCKRCPTILLMTRAGSSSVSFYFINNVLMMHIPTVPETFVQTVGRICRLNTLYPDDLNVYVMQSSNIDEYKLRLVTNKVEQMETVSGYEANIPSWFRGRPWSEKSVRAYKHYFLWK